MERLSNAIPNNRATFASPSLARTTLLALIAIVILFFIDAFLAKTEIFEGRVEAQRFYDDGRRLMFSGMPDEAVDKFRAAIAAARQHPEYQLAFIEALMAANRWADAEMQASDLLQREANNGQGNLLMARIRAHEGNNQDAYSYYHRAIYGQWNDQALQNRVRVRFELVNLLVSQHATENLLAELLPLQQEAPSDPETRIRLGDLFISAGSPSRAAELFRSILKERPQNADAVRGLASAELAAGNYRAAVDRFSSALQLKPGDAEIQRGLTSAKEALELDPTQRGLGIQEQLRRSNALMDRLVAAMQPCVEAKLSAEGRLLLQQAQAIRKQRVPYAQQSAVYEQSLELADKLGEWSKTECSGTPLAEPLALVLTRIHQ